MSLGQHSARVSQILENSQPALSSSVGGVGLPPWCENACDFESANSVLVTRFLVLGCLVAALYLPFEIL